jgi:hypothetical protein
MAQSSALPAEQYNYDIVRKFTIVAMVFAVLGMSVGVYIASELAWPFLNFDIPALTFGRLRPVHTTLGDLRFRRQRAVRHLLLRRPAHLSGTAGFSLAGRVHLLGLDRRRGAGRVHLHDGLTQGREYAEFEWPLDIAITLVWVSYFAVYVETLRRRSQPHIYVANWFYLAFILAVALLHIFNNLAVPVSLTKSYSLFSGVQDAMTQWWYGHNAVGFFLTAAFLGMMYYFVPKQAGRPVYSYRLSIIHFWALIFPVHVGRWSSPALDLVARLGLDPVGHLLHDAADALLGRHDQRHHDPVRRLGQAALRPDHAVPDHLAVVLRHVHLRRSVDVAEERQCPVALHRLDHRPCAFRRAGLGGAGQFRRLLSPDPAVVGAPSCIARP